MTIKSTTVGKNPLEEMGVALIVNKRVCKAVLESVSKITDVSVRFQGKPSKMSSILYVDCLPSQKNGRNIGR